MTDQMNAVAIFFAAILATLGTAAQAALAARDRGFQYRGGRNEVELLSWVALTVGSLVVLAASAWEIFG